MTDQTKAPERIWVETRTCTVDAIGASRLLAMDREFSRGIEYIRKDLSDAKDKRIAELEAERDETMREALSLARSLHKAHYSDVTQWEPLNYPAGVVSQIDNMVAGIVARAEAAEAKLAKAVDALNKAKGNLYEVESYDMSAFEALRVIDATPAELKGTDQ